MVLSRKLEQVIADAKELIRTEDRVALRQAFRHDLFTLLAFGLNRIDLLSHQFFLDRCDDVQREPDGCLDLWAREHGKSSIITFGKTVQDILRDPEITVGIFSHTRPNAKGFLKQIRREFDSNDLLKELFDDVLWANARSEAPSWSEDGGLIVKRVGNPKEATVEAWGLVDGQPIGKHFKLMVYDDVVTAESVTTPEMRNKVLSAFELSINLGTRGGARRMIGTRYHYQDAYRDILERNTARPRVHPATGPNGPVLLTQEELDTKRQDMGPYTYSAQMELDPKGDDSIGFKKEWLRYYDGIVEAGNRYMLVDPANAKKKRSDYTAIWVIECSPDQNVYVRDIVRDRLNLAQRNEMVIDLHREWKPRRVGYEQYGMMADVEALRNEQERQGYRFEVVELGGRLSKEDRIMRLVPRFARGGIYLPHSINKMVRTSGREENMVDAFVNQEYLGWPYVGHDDLLDGLARMEDEDMKIVFPKQRPANDTMPLRRRVGWVV